MGEEVKTTETPQAEVEVEVDVNETVTFDDGQEEAGAKETPAKEAETETPAVEVEVKPEVKPTETEVKTETETETPINQEAVNKRINKITFEKHEERRLREEAEAKLAEANKKLTELTKPEGAVVIPEIPDIYDPDYQQKLVLREEAIAKKAAQDAEATLAANRQAEAVRDLNEKKQAEIQELVDTMYKAGDKVGVSAEDLKKADEKVAMFIQDPELATFILRQDHSPLIVKYLAGNAVELEKVAKMNPLDAATHIATVVSVEANKLMPDVTKTPAPLEIPKGKTTTQQSEFLDGVDFE